MKRSILSRKCAWFLAIALAAPTMVSPVALAADAKEVKLDAAQQDAATKLRAKGASVMQIAADTDALEVNLSILGKQANDDDLALVKMLPKVTQLNLRNTSITDKGLANIAGFIALTQLHLDGTGITDAGLVHLKGLAALDYLNLYNTAVTDDGLKSLDGLKKLKHVYLWQTKVTVAGGKALKSALPELIINRGEELTLPPPATKPAEVKPADVKPGDPKPADPKPVKNPKKKKPDDVPAAAIPDCRFTGRPRPDLQLSRGRRLRLARLRRRASPLDRAAHAGRLHVREGAGVLGHGRARRHSCD